MKIYHHIKDFKAIKNAVVTIGTFDGVHLGHQKIIDQLLAEAKNINGEVVVLTFFPHPRMILHPEDKQLKLINTVTEKAKLLEKLGVDHLIITPFTRDFSNLTPEDYIKDILVKQIGTKKIIIGYDHHFGKDRAGTFNDLKKFSKIYDYELIEIPKQDIDNVAISSTKIREALAKGDVKIANRYMTHPFTLSGKVIRGDQIGRTLGYPTANLFIEEQYKMLPSDGIYAVKIAIDNDYEKNKNQLVKPIFQTSFSDHSKEIWYYGMAYIGHRPTINGLSQNIEVNIFNFNQDIYFRTIHMQFLEFIRNDIKFNSLDELTEQLAKDKLATLNFFKLN